MGIPKHRPIRLLVQGEFMITTGFGGVTVNLCDRLHNARTEWGAKKYEVHVMALGLQSNPFDNFNVRPYKVWPMYGNRDRAPFGQDYAADLISKVKPDVVLAFGDTWMLDFWNEPGAIPAELRKTFKLLGYVAIDGYPLPRFWIDKYRRFDKLLTFTKFGKDTIDERAKELEKVLDTDFIYHGVDPQVFKPLPKSEIDNFKRSRGIDENKKVIGMFSRNQPRKHHPEFVEFAAELLKKVNYDPNYLFYFHTMENDAGWDLNALIDDIGMMGYRKRLENDGWVGPNQDFANRIDEFRKRFIFPGITNPGAGYPIELLNMMYNICDAHVLLTSGEGFGCTLIESMSAGIPTFTNDYAAGGELVRGSGAGEVIRARDFTFRGSDHNFIRPHTDYNDAVTKVLNCINNEEVKTKFRKKGRAFALSNSWDIIVEDWQVEIDKMFEENLKTINTQEV